MPPAPWTDEKAETAMASLLRAGVLLAAGVVVAGAVIFLIRHGLEPPGHRVFRGEPAGLRGVWGILRSAAGLQGRGIIQLGLLLLIATPVARVALSVYAFVRQRDRIYVGVTLLVLTLLLIGLNSGGM